MKFIHSADFHLGMKFEKSSIPQSMSKIRRQRIWTSVEKLIKYGGAKLLMQYISMSYDWNFTGK